MERIASFCVDHTTLMPGMYLSRQDGEVRTWDVRMKRPNQGDYPVSYTHLDVYKRQVYGQLTAHRFLFFLIHGRPSVISRKYGHCFCHQGQS